MHNHSSPELPSKARAVHDKRSLGVAVFFTLLHYLCVIGFLTSIGIIMAYPTARATPPATAFAAASLLTWFVSFVRRRSARCPLCKGSPLYDSGAAKHVRALRVPPFSYGTTAVLSILFLNRFRCMYCGTPYDMLKEPSSARQQARKKS